MTAPEPSITELHAELAASRFDVLGAVPGWFPVWRARTWQWQEGTYHAEVWVVWSPAGSRWHWRVFNSWEPAATLARGSTETPRAAMRAADAARLPLSRIAVQPMLTLVCGHPHCSAEATDEVVYPRVRWFLCTDHADIERAFVAQFRNTARSDATTCRMPGCLAPLHAIGLCNPHYQRVRRRGLTPDVRRREAAVALRTLPGTPPTPDLSSQPAWVQTAVRRRLTDAWAGLRQELHHVAGISL